MEVAAAGATPPATLPAGATAVARIVTVPVTEQAVGTIRAQHETTIASRILARVVEINVRAGQQIKAGEVLVRLDDTDLRARLEQAEAAAVAAQAECERAEIEYRRVSALIEQKAVSQNEYELAQTALKSAQANLARARQAVAEARAVLEYATIRSPIDGLVVDKRVNVGDTVTPGQPLLSLYDPTRMQLVADVRESLARRLEVGQQIPVHIEALDKACIGQISEIVPNAQTASRSFQVKVVGPCPPGLYTGMFGRITIPLEQRQALVIPRSAVRRVGQLELVDVVDERGIIRRRAVRIGRDIGQDDVEVLSGLKTGETVVLPRLQSGGATTSNAGDRQP
jgi:RND family efflux transporter MFP subunit